MQTRQTFVATGLAVLVCVGLTGCDGAAPQPSEDAVYYFLANARLNGKMRVCWKEGQEYAVAVTKADAALQAELAPLRALRTYDASWDREDPRWADATAVNTHAEELAKLADEGAKTRATKLDELRAALDKLPAPLTWPDDAAKEAFKQQLWSALAVDGEPIEDAVRRLEELLAARLRLFEKVVACTEFAVADQEDVLTFSDETCQQEVNELYEGYQAQVQADREHFFAWSASRIAETAPTLKTIDKQKDRERYNLLDNERGYIRNRLEAMQKELREMIKTANEQVAELKKTEPEDSPKLKRLEHDISAREAQLAELLKRSDSILKQ